jgi:hypothetical protein
MSVKPCQPHIPFQVGSEVSWSLTALEDLEYLTSILGHLLASRVTHAYDHHSIEPVPVSETMTVRSIKAVRCRFARRTDADIASYPVAGSGSVEDRTSATRSGEKDEGDVHFVAYLVEVESGSEPSLPPLVMDHPTPSEP